MLAQKLFELIGIEIRKHFIPGNESGDVSLVGKFLHLFVSLSILTDID